MKTGILAAFALMIGACSGQVVGNSAVGSVGAGLGGIGGVITCATPSACPKKPCPIGQTCPVHDEAVSYYGSYAYGDNSQLSPEEQLIEKQMEAELEAEQARVATEQSR